ncbi:MAG: hypothetical protein A3F13_08495 [Gammaproteobacteria bacterium RIFCSPHIGHO2_12_FULL_40_19]|nr:MAG: hypothetical protein A3F13_08495 [Gammaproteobacteria bacterium RIFCSPHIGHO2_12_FULL_40_19]
MRQNNTNPESWRLWFTHASNNMVDFSRIGERVIASKNWFPHYSQKEIADRLLIFASTLIAGYAGYASAPQNPESVRDTWQSRMVLSALSGFFVLQLVVILLLIQKRRNMQSMNECTASIEQSVDFSLSVQQLLTLGKKSVAIFDIDNTLLITIGYRPNASRTRQSGYGSDIWFSAVFSQLDKTSPDFHTMYLLLLSEYFIIQQHAQHVTTEDCVPALLAQLKENNISVLGLTTRTSCISDITLQRLAELGIQFSHHDAETMTLPVSIKDCSDDAIFKQGVIFCSGRSKKLCLDAFINTSLGLSLFQGVETVLFMDDKLSHCEEVSQYLRLRVPASRTVHYTHVEEDLPVADKAQIDEDRSRLSVELEREFRF